MAHNGRFARAHERSRPADELVEPQRAVKRNAEQRQPQGVAGDCIALSWHWGLHRPVVHARMPGMNAKVASSVAAVPMALRARKPQGSVRA